MNITAQTYYEIVEENKRLTVENHLLKSNLIKANIRAELLQKDLDDNDDWNIHVETSTINANMKRGNHEVN